MISPLSGESTAESAGLVFGPSGVSATVDRVAVEPGRSSAVKGESIAWDFRNGGMPAGIDVVGGEPEFVPQQDGSTVLRLQPLSYLKV